MRGAVHHIDLTVKDAHASRAFYESVLGFMGYRYALFFYSTKTAGGRVYFEYNRIGPSGGSR